MPALHLPEQMRMSSDSVLDSCEVGRLVQTAGSLLLREPDELLCDQLNQAGCDLSLHQAQQIFYDRFCIASSPDYRPPYEHAFSRGKFRDGTWHFPPARYDGGASVEAAYRRFGFKPADLAINPMLRAAHLPGDHLGFMLVYAGTVLCSELPVSAEWSAIRLYLGGFVQKHLGDWVDDYCRLLGTGDLTGYSETIAAALAEAVALLRSFCSG